MEQITIRKTLLIMLTALLLFTACNTNGNQYYNTNDDVALNFIYSVSERRYLLTVADEVLIYRDLSDPASSAKPLCGKPNCTHDNENCAAYSLKEVRYPFFYNDKLYYFHEAAFYSSNKDGTNQRRIFSIDEGFYLENVKLFNEIMVFNIYSEELDGFNHGRNYRVCAYDFLNSKFNLVLETGVKYNSGISHIGIINGCLYSFYTGRDYPLEVNVNEDIWELRLDKNSIFYKDYYYEYRKIPLIQNNPLDYEYEVVNITASELIILDDYIFAYSEDEYPAELYRINVITNESDLIFTGGIIYLQIYDGKIQLRTGEYNEETKRVEFKNPKRYYLSGDKFIEIENAGYFNFYYESEEYLFGVFGGLDDYVKGYIKKTDYYNGFTEFVEMEGELW